MNFVMKNVIKNGPKGIIMAYKVKNCYGCPAHTDSKCLLDYERNAVNCNINGPKGGGHITIHSPKECCHKPKTIKEFLERFKNK